jgi:hypothetical protein
MDAVYSHRVKSSLGQKSAARLPVLLRVLVNPLEQATRRGDVDLSELAQKKLLDFLDRLRCLARQDRIQEVDVAVIGDRRRLRIGYR